MLDKEELLYNELYEKTKDCGRTQFIRLLMEKERKIQELKEQLDDPWKGYSELQEENENLLSRIRDLKKQLGYLRSGEYYNQLKFERDMLQDVVDHGEVSKEDKEFIDMTHRNTELLEENQKLKSELELYENGVYFSSEVDEKGKQIDKLKNQQEKFIKYCEELIDEIVSSHHFKYTKVDYVIQMILNAYKEMIGDRQ